MMKKENYILKLKNRLNFFLLLGSFLLVSKGVFSQDVSTGLILHYDFDAISGVTVPDVSGNTNIGTLYGTPKDTAGYRGNAIYLADKPSYIKLPAGINSSLSSFTFAAWVKIDALKNATRFFDLGTGADASNNFLAFIPSYNGDNQVMCLRYRPTSGTAYNVLSTAKFPTGVWAHVAVTYDWNGSSGTATIYLNGLAVGSASNLPYNISTNLGSTTDNYIGESRWTQDTNGFGGAFDDVRFYNRALTATDILTLNGLSELNNEYNKLTIGDISAVTSNLTLPTSLGSSGVTVTWSSSKPSIIDSVGVVTQPAKYDSYVTLTAVLSQTVGGKNYTMMKPFIVKVLGVIPTPEQVAEWNFTVDNIDLVNDTLRVKDVQSGFVGKLVNDARIRTIGSSTQYNVLDLGNGTGFFDMGQDIGKAIYTFRDYTIMGYFRVASDYTELSSSGNMFYAFSNTTQGDVGKNGYVIGRLNNQGHQCTSGYWSSGKMEIAVGTPAPIGAWHHFCYVQSGTTGTIYVDGVSVASGTMTNLPSTSIALSGRDGTWYNWLGRSIGLSSDVYLRKTLIYDFQVLSIPITSDDLNFGIFEVPATLDKLNTAYAENSDYTAPELAIERDSLSLGNLSAVTSNINLPVQGRLDPTIKIKWSTTNSKLIDANGIVTRPDYYNYNDTLTATLIKNGQSLTKAFPATVILKDNSQFTNDLVLKYDFSNSHDSIVVDAAEKHFNGTLKNQAKIERIGITNKFNVLNLGDSIGYFDMGTEIGKVFYNLADYTVSAYYRIDSTNVSLANAGNFLFSFSNTDNVMRDQNGYLIASLKDQSISISPKYYTSASGNQAVSASTPALKGDWHHLAYTQHGTTGTLYIDGVAFATSDSITNLPKTALPQRNQLGTLFNWIGRSPYSSDVYLRNTLVYDFRVYSRALTDSEIQNDILKVNQTIANLNAAYAEGPTAINDISNSNYKIISVNQRIKIIGLKGNEKISVFDLAGRQIRMVSANSISLETGVYLVKIDHYIAKVIVR